MLILFTQRTQTSATIKPNITALKGAACPVVVVFALLRWVNQAVPLSIYTI